MFFATLWYWYVDMIQMQDFCTTQQPSCLVPVNILSCIVIKCCKIVSLVKNMALWNLYFYLYFILYGFKGVMSHLCLWEPISFIVAWHGLYSIKYLEIQREWGLFCHSYLFDRKAFMHYENCLMKNVQSYYTMAISPSPDWYVCVCLCLGLYHEIGKNCPMLKSLGSDFSR